MVGATRRTIAAIASLLMVLFWVPGLLAPSASAATPVASQLVGGFEIDGNFTPNDLAGSPGVDWNNVTAVETPDKVGNVDDTNFSGGSKECTNTGNCSVDNWVGATGVAPNKADISNVYVATRLLPRVGNPSKTDVWGYFGLTRLDNNGSVFYDIELNQKVNKPNKNGISAPDRSDGDVLIILDQNGNGDFSFSGSIQKWVAVGNSDACQSGLVKPCWGVQTSLSSLGAADFFGKSNPTTIPGYKGVGSYASDEFGEVGVNLSAAGAIAGCPSTGFNVVNVRSKASPGTPNATDGDVTGSAEIKDYVAADVGIPSSCGELIINKYGPGTSTTKVSGATFTIDPNPIPGQTGTLTVHEGNEPGIDTVADGIIDIDPAKPGTYTVTETAPPPGYLLPTSPTQNNVVVTEFGSGANATVVSFHDPLGSLVIHKTDPAGAALAGSTFTLTGPNGYSDTIFDADAGTNSDGNGNGTLTWSGLKTGTYTLHENSAPTGYDTVADRTFTIQSSDDDATHGRDLSATISDPKKTTTLSVWKYHTEADKTKTNLQGAVFKLYQSDSNVALANFDPSTATLVGSCTTAANGICTVPTDSPAGDPGTHVITWDHYYYWVEQSVPFPYTVPDVNTFGPVHITAANIDDTRQPTPADDPKAQLTTTATASVTLPLAAGAGIKDTAHLSGVNSNAGGAIVFNAYGPDPTSCTGAPAFTSTVTGVHGPGDYDSAVFTPTTAGAYKWSATYYPAYPGNTNDFVAAACTDPTELSTVNPAQPTMTTTATDTHTTSGKIHDTAQLAGYAPPLTGVQVTFKLFTANTCTAGTEIFTSTVAVDSNGFAQSGDYTVTNTTGTYYWQATLTGNTNNGTTNIGNDCGSTVGGNSEVSHAPVIAGSKASNPATGSAASPTPVDLGSTIVYTVTVTNTGGTSATGVAVSDTVPTGTTYVANSADHNGTVTNGVVSWTVDVPAASHVDLHFSVTVDSTDTNGQKIDNVAVVNAGNTNATHHVVNFPVITAAKSSSPAYTTGNPPTPVSPGQTITYTIDVTNSGLADATGVAVSDTVPANSTYVPNSADHNGGLVGNAVTWSVDVAAGDTVHLHFQVTVDPKATNGTLVDNTATYANVNSPGCAAASCTTNTTHHVVQFAIISAVKTANPAYDPAKGPTPVKPGQTITYTIAVSNSGLGDATGVPVSDTIPTGSTYVAGSADHNGTFAAGKVSWTIDVAHGTTVNLKFQVTVDANDPNGTTIDNTAVVDNTPTNTTHHVVQFPIIGALKTSDPQSGTSAQPASVKPGQTISYTIAVSNSGQADDPAVAVSDAIPTGSTYVANSADNGGTFANGTVSWTVAVAAGKTVNLHFQVTVDANDPNGTRIENTAVVNGANTNTTYHVVQFPIVGAVKSSNPAYTAGNPPTPVQPGQTIDYTIAVSNTGQADATNVTVNDPIPAGSTYVAGSADNGGTFSNGAVSWVLPTVGAGTTVNVHFQVTVDAADANGTTIDNVAVVNGTPTNTTHHVVQFAVLAMGKTANPASGSIVQRGDTVTYAITVVNSGLAAANGVTVSDTLPDHVTLVSGSAQPAVTSASGKTLTWLVDVLPGTTKTVTYAVTVDSDAPEGATLTNVALIGGSCVGHADPAACTTDHHVPTGALTLVKHVDKTSAEYGDTLTYTFDAATTGALNQTGVTVTDVVPDKSTYVDSSAACDTGTCTTAYDAATRTVTWTLGDMAAGAVRHVTFQVTIDKPDFDSTVGLPAETITNLGNIQSLETATTPSNPVETKIVEVLGVKIVRKPPVTKPRLPFTGMPTQEAVTLALLMIAGGIVLASVRRRGDA